MAFEAFKAGALDWHTENVAKTWATGYGFPAALKRQVIREEFPIRNIGTMQAFAFNTRRTKFRDTRVRRAFNFAFDFEKLNQELFYGAYTRISSYFDGTEMASYGLPEGRGARSVAGGPVRSAPGSIHRALLEPGWRRQRGGARQFVGSNAVIVERGLRG